MHTYVAVSSSHLACASQLPFLTYHIPYMHGPCTRAGNATFPNPADNPRIERISVLSATPGVVLSAGTDVIVTVTYFCSPGVTYGNQTIQLFVAIVPEAPALWSPGVDGNPFIPWELKAEWICDPNAGTSYATFTFKLPEAPPHVYTIWGVPNRNGATPVAVVRAMTTLGLPELPIDYYRVYRTGCPSVNSPLIGPTAPLWREADDLTFSVAPSGELVLVGQFTLQSYITKVASSSSSSSSRSRSRSRRSRSSSNHVEGNNQRSEPPRGPKSAERGATISAALSRDEGTPRDLTTRSGWHP